MKIYYLEDDWRYATQIRTQLERLSQARGLRWNLERIATEKAFIELLDELAAGRKPRPDCFILDVMVRYADTSPDASENQEEGQDSPNYDRAGLRCASLLRRTYPTVPVILFTILDSEDIEADLEDAGLRDVRYVPKSDRITPLFEQLVSVLK